MRDRSISLPKGVSRTALIVAEWRSQEANERPPFFSDPFARLFLNAESRALADRMERLMPQAKVMVRLRTRYFDDLVSAFVASGGEQVLLLGAGLDSRALRFSAKGTRYFEVDMKPMLIFKRAVLRDNSMASPSISIDCDYVKENLIDKLRGAGVRSDARTLVVWEGNTLYIPRREIDRVLRLLSAFFGPVLVGFDYTLESVITRTTGYPEVTAIANGFEAIGAPWVTGFNDIRDAAERVGYTLLTTSSCRTILERVHPTSIGGKVYDVYHFCLLEARV